jgi:hypothetical protein
VSWVLDPRGRHFGAPSWTPHPISIHMSPTCQEAPPHWQLGTPIPETGLLVCLGLHWSTGACHPRGCRWTWASVGCQGVGTWPSWWRMSILASLCSQACRYGHVQHLEHLLFYGADMGAQNASGNTALHICALYNQVSGSRDPILPLGPGRDVSGDPPLLAAWVGTVPGGKGHRNPMK